MKKVFTIIFSHILLAILSTNVLAQGIFETNETIELSNLKTAYSPAEINNPASILHFYKTNFERNNPYPYYPAWLTDTLNPWVIDTTYTENIWQIGKPNKAGFDSAFTTPNAMVTDTTNPYPINNHSTFQFNIKKPWWNMHRGWSYLSLFFNHKYETDSLYDGGYIDISYDGGQTFTNIVYDKNLNHNMAGVYRKEDTINGGIPAFTGTLTEWDRTNFIIEWPEEEWEDVDSMIVRFNFKSDGINNNKLGWLIDDIRIRLEGHLGIGIKDETFMKNFQLYPNPVGDILNIKQITANVNINNISIYSVTGKLVWSQNYSSNENLIQVNLTNQQAGMYFIKITDIKSNTYTQKFIKQ